VTPSPSCANDGGKASSLQLVLYSGNIYWTDANAGTVNSVATSGGTPTTLVTGESAPGAIFVYSGAGPSTGTLYWIDSGNNTVRSLAPGADGGSAKTLIAMGRAPPGDSGVTTADDSAGMGIVHGLTMSGDGTTLYFGAGVNIYKMKADGSGNGAFAEVGSSHGSAGVPWGMATDDTYLYYAAMQSGSVEIMSIANPCSPGAALGGLCPIEVARGQGGMLAASVLVANGNVYWANDTAVHQKLISQALDAGTGSTGGDSPNTMNSGSVTGYALGSTNLYYGEDGYIERSALPAPGVSLVTVIANNQPLPSSFAVDGTNVYWTTGRCDIMKIADSPQ